jgi:hypothetical protein
MVFAMEPPVVGASAAIEAGLAAEMGAATTAGVPALVGVTPMGADADSAEFAAALNAVGAAYTAVTAEHAAQRALFSGAQSMAGTTAVATEAMRAAASTL